MTPPTRQAPPYGGPEETSEVKRVRERRATHPGLPIDIRVHAAEERAAAAEEVAISVGRELAQWRDEQRQANAKADKILAAIHGPDNQPELGLVWKVAQLGEMRMQQGQKDRDYQKIKHALITTALVALVAWLVQLYVSSHR